MTAKELIKDIEGVFKLPVKKTYFGKIKYYTPYFEPRGFCNSIIKVRKLIPLSEEELAPLTLQLNNFIENEKQLVSECDLWQKAQTWQQKSIENQRNIDLVNNQLQLVSEKEIDAKVDLTKLSLSIHAEKLRLTFEAHENLKQLQKALITSNNELLITCKNTEEQSLIVKKSYDELTEEQVTQKLADEKIENLMIEKIIPLDNQISHLIKQKNESSNNLISLIDSQKLSKTKYENLNKEQQLQHACVGQELC